MMPIWLTALLTCLSLPAWAELPAVCPRPIAVAFYDLGVLYNPATAQGLDRDVITALSERTGCHFAAKFESRVRIWTTLAAGTLDMSVSGIATPERRQFAEFAPYFWVRNELVMRADTTVSSPDAFLANPLLRLGVVKSYKHGEVWDKWIDQLRQRGRVDELADTASLFEQLEASRIQAFPALTLVTLTMAERYPSPKVRVRLNWFADQPKIEHGLILSKARLSPELVGLIQQTIREMLSDGSLRQLYMHHMTAQDADALLKP